MKNDKNSILFFDGICGLCSGFVSFYLKFAQTSSPIKLAPLQGETAKTLLTPEYRKVDTLVFYQKGAVYIEEQAVFLILSELKAPWRWFALGKYFPRFFSKFIYKLISRYRYKIGGKKKECFVPPVDKKNQFLN